MRSYGTQKLFLALALSLFSMPVLISTSAPTDKADNLQAQVEREVIVVWKSPQATRRAHTLSNSSRETKLAPAVSVIKTNSGAEADKLMQQLADNSDIQSVEPNQVVQLALPHTSSDEPNDPAYAEQWNVPMLHVTEAWEMMQPTSQTVKVAVIDSGIDMAHPDLAGVYLPGKDYVDGDDIPHDLHGHGTHVTGIIAAHANNGIAISGLIGTQKIKIIPLRVLDKNASGTIASEVAAIYDAVNMGADVINISLGSSAYSQAEHEAIRYATEQGVIIVAATGNDATKVDYPAALEEVIAVTSTTYTDDVSWFSNIGSQVDVAAPGELIVSIVPTSVSADGYDYMSGTSMATPHVAALAALLKAQAPTLTRTEIEQLLFDSCVDIGKVGKDHDSGFGRIDFQKAMQKLQEKMVPPDATKTYQLSTLTSDPTTFHQLLSTYRGEQLTVTKTDGQTLPWSELMTKPDTLTSVFADSGAHLQVNTANSGTKGFLHTTLAWDTTNVSQYVPMIISPETIWTESELSSRIQLTDSDGKKMTGMTITKGTGSHFYVDRSTPFILGKTYRLTYMEKIPLAQFTVTRKSLVKTIGFARTFGVQRDVPLAKTFEVVFTKPMRAETVGTTSVWIEDDRGKKVPATVSLDNTKRIASVNPENDFAPGRMYFLKVSNQAQSATDQALKMSVLLPFRTVYE